MVCQYAFSFFKQHYQQWLELQYVKILSSVCYKHTNGSRDLYEYVFLPQVFMICHFQDRRLEIQSFSTCPLSPLHLDISILLGVSPTKSGLRYAETWIAQSFSLLMQLNVQDWGILMICLLSGSASLISLYHVLKEETAVSHWESMRTENLSFGRTGSLQFTELS